MIKIRKVHIVIWGILLLFPVIGLCFYPFMSEQVGVHWSGWSPQPDSYQDRMIGTFLLPMIVIAIFPLFASPMVFIPSQARIARRFYEVFFVLFLLFLLHVHVCVLLWNVGVKVHVPLSTTVGGVTFLIALVAAFVLFRKSEKSRLRQCPGQADIARCRQQV